MKNKFENLLNQYKMLLEQPEADPTMGAEVNATPPDVGATPPAQGAPAQAPAPAQQPTSVGYAVLVQVLLDAFKTLNVRNKADIKFSDNQARTPQEAYKYLEIVKRNLEPDLQRKTQQNVGDTQQGAGNVESSDIVNITNLALKAIFFPNKDPQTSEYNDIASNDKVDVNNAKEIFNAIRNYLAER